ncbi:MAG: GAF and ANTAR domain-containing protein [Mycobacteriaceae bacterium]
MMAETRERDIVRAFVELSGELVDGYDMVDLLAEWTANCARLLDVAAAGLLLADGRGVLHLVAASSERTHHLEVFQLQRHQGPCLDCFHSGAAVIVPDLVAESARWPDFATVAQSVGIASVHAFPMRLRDRALGTLGLFGDAPGRLDEDDLELAQALVHVASVAIVNEKAASDREMVNAQLQHALTSRIVLEQAKGVLASAGQLTMDDAFRVLRRYARDHGRKLSIVADGVVQRELRAQELIDHARSAAILP